MYSGQGSAVVQHTLQLLLEHLALLVPVGGGGVVGQLPAEYR